MESFKGNEHLRTRNEILIELNQSGYYVTRPFTRGCDFDYLVYERLEGQYIKFMFGLNTTKYRVKTVLFNGKPYNAVDKLIEAVTAFNRSRMFPSEYYDPGYVKSYAVEGKVSWYLTDILGFKPSRDMNGHMRTYVKKDLYGQEISSIGFEVKEDGSGTIIRATTASSWIRNNFTDAEDAVAKINGILTLELASNVSKSFEALTHMNAFNASVEGAAKTTVDNSLNVFTEDYKDKIINKLESVLSKLKEE